MTETQAHKDLKKLAHIILYKEGFNETEIYDEYVLDVPKSTKRNFRVDVVGLSKNKKIAVELGTTNSKKLTQLELFFDKVIHIPYGIEGFEEIQIDQIIKYKTINESLTDTIEKLKNEIKEKERKIQNIEKTDEYEKQADKAMDILKCIRIGLSQGVSLNDALRNSITCYNSSSNWSRPQKDKEVQLEDIYKIIFPEHRFY